MSLKVKFLIIFILLSNIPIVIITLFTYNRYTGLVDEQMSQVSKSVFEKAMEEANGAIGNLNHIAEIFNFYSESQDAIVEDLKKYTEKDGSYTDFDVFTSNQNIKFICKNLIFSSDYINGIYVFTPSGEVLGYGTSDLHYDYTPEEDDWYRATLAKEGKTYIDGISTKDFILHAEPSISFARALYDVYSHEFLGVLYIDCKPDVFNLSSINTLPETMVLAIENTETGYFLYSNVDELYDGFKGSKARIHKEQLDMKELTLISATNYDLLYEEFRFTRILIILIGLICAVVFVIVSIVLSFSLTKPITYLSEKMGNYKGHNLVTTEKYLRRNDEIGVLCNEYNTMIEELNSFIKNEYQNKLILLDSQMKSLEAQINSHFLYNTLESINSIAEIEEVESISTMSLALGKMFRYSIKTKSELVTIQDELNHVQDYLSIQKIRFNNQFDVQIDFPEDMLQMKVLKLILQPLVENALIHGLDNCQKGSRLQIQGSRNERALYIEVRDDGVGMNEVVLNRIRLMLKEEARFTELGHRNKQSIGLKNIHSRIELYYGQGYGLSIQSEEDKGTTITVKCPIV